jgi:replicative DNA helicase
MQPAEPTFEEAFEEAITTNIPHNREAEEAVIGSVLLDPDIYHDLVHVLSAGDFFIHRLRWVWEAYEKLQERNVPIDILTTVDELIKSNRLDEVGGSAYLTSLLNQVPFSTNATHYANTVKGNSIRRKLIIAANSIANLAYDQKETIETVMGGSEKAVFDITDGILKVGDIKAKDAASELYDDVWQMKNDGCAPGILTGHIDFDRIMGGLRNGTSGIIAGRPGQGKTALLLTWLVFIMTHGDAPPFTVLNSMEMTPKRIIGRMAAILAGINAQNIRDGTLTDDEIPLFLAAIETISSWPLVIIDERDPLALFSKISHMHIKGECDLLLNDYVGKFEAKAESRVRQVGIASQVISKIAVKVNIPVITAAQVSRTIDTRGKDSELVLSDLKETGDLEQDADYVLFINPDTSPMGQNVKHCNIAKNRDGAVGRFDLIFRHNFVRFENAVSRNFTEYRDISEPKTED